MSDADNTTAVQDFYARVLSGDAESAIAQYLAPDFVWENPLPAPVPFGGSFEGAAGVIEYLGLVFGTLDLDDFQIEDVIAGGDRVVVLGHETGRVKVSGRTYTNAWVHVLRFVDGRITHLREYNDTAAILGAFS